MISLRAKTGLGCGSPLPERQGKGKREKGKSMEGDLTWCKFRFSWIKVFKTLSGSEKDRLLDAIEAYTNDKELPELLGKELVAWAFIEAELESDKESRRKAADAHRKAGASGGRPKTNENQMKPNETKNNQIGFCEENKNQKNQIGLRVKELRDKELRDKREEERDIEKDAQSAKTRPQKHRMGNFRHVLLTDEELQRLEFDYPEKMDYIQKLDDYLENNPSKHYANHNLTIRNWIRKDAEKQQTAAAKPEPKRTYSFTEVGEMMKRGEL